MRTIETMRDLARQTWYVETGVSRTMHSLHLPQPPTDLARAFDLCPYDYLIIKNWNPGGKLWRVMGDAGRGLGLEWGGDWPTFKDQPHFQLSKCAC